MAEVLERKVDRWGNGLALRLTGQMAEVVGVQADSPVKVTVEPGRLIVEPLSRRPTLEEMLAAFDPQRHGGEIMAVVPVGNEIL